jgi:hypothetical protein
MKTLARAKLAAAIGTALTAVALSTPVMAVSHSDTGLGEVGLIPYYTSRDGYVTNISVANTSDVYVAAFKIRILEGANSREARDFNVFLSPDDVWTATIALGEDGMPYIQTVDTSCAAPTTVVPQPGESVAAQRQRGFVVVGQTPDGRDIKQLDFTNIGYAGGSTQPADGGSTDIERTQDGHVEIVAMGVADPAESPLAARAVHGPTLDCAALANVYEPVSATITVSGSGPLECNLDTPFAVGDVVGGNAAFEAEFCEPLNVLKVAADILRVDQGVSTGLPVSMLSNFFNPDTVEDPLAPAAADLMDFPGTITPNLEAAFPPISAQIANGAPIIESFNPPLGRPVDAVSSLFSATAVLNEYAIGGAAQAQNAWVVTFPTKNYYVDTDRNASGVPIPFQEMFQPSGESCVDVGFDYFDREEASPQSPPGVILPSPIPIDVPVGNEICEEVQTINFTEDGLLGARTNYLVPLEEGFTSGWMRLTFPGAGAITGDSGIVFNGLPVIGFSFKTLDNGVAGPNALTYGITTAHAYQRVIDQ